VIFWFNTLPRTSCYSRNWRCSSGWNWSYVASKLWSDFCL